MKGWEKITLTALALCALLLAGVLVDVNVSTVMVLAPFVTVPSANVTFSAVDGWAVIVN